jgi:hypothetical protein
MQMLIKQQVMSSKEIAKLTGKKHSHVLRDIRSMIDSIGGKTLENVDFVETYQVNNKLTAEIFIKNEIAEVLLKRYNRLGGIPMRLQEEAALKTIEQVVGTTLIRQYKCLSYRIDGYDPISNVAYEIDEPAHKYKKCDDICRQRAIERELGCTFVRIKL